MDRGRKGSINTSKTAKNTNPKTNGQAEPTADRPLHWLPKAFRPGTPYLPSTSSFVIADLILEVFLQNVSYGELLPSHVNAGHRVGDVDEDAALVYILHSEAHSADVTCHTDTCLRSQSRMERFKKIQLICGCVWRPGHTVFWQGFMLNSPTMSLHLKPTVI